MVAYTSPDCLPYFEGTDSPCLNTGTLCDPSTLWCDFAEIVEGRLDEFDDVVARTATSTPIAWVQTTTAFTSTAGVNSEVFVPFDTVRMDTDNMVNLDANPNGFYVNTSGLYTVFGYAFGSVTITGAFSATLDLDFIPSSSAYPANYNSLFVNHSINFTGALLGMNIHFTVPLFAGQQVIANINCGGTANDSITLSQVSLGVAWMGGLP